MNPSADVLALASTEVDLSPIEEGQRITVTWRGKPIFIDNRTPEQIEAALDVDLESLPDPQSDAERIKEGRANWLVLVGVCTARPAHR
jgi:ubiquinol-cytochrome c reductase iron-sulfur subunit